MEITRSLFHLGRSYMEMFNVYGENGVLEWPQMEGQERPVLHELTPVQPHQWRKRSQKRIEIPDYTERLPEPIQWKKNPVP